MNYEIDTQNNQGMITINDEISLQMVKQLKVLFDQAMNETQIIMIHMKDVTYIDLSFFQLLCAAQQKCLANQQRIIFHPSSVQQMKEYVKQAGFSHAIMVDEQ